MTRFPRVNPISLLKKSLHSAVFWKFASSGLRFGGFIFILPLTLRQLSSEELGMWYTMQAAFGLTSLLDMGFAPTASRMAAYFWGGAKELQPHQLKEEAKPDILAEPNIIGLIRLSNTMRWFYFGLGVLSCSLLGILGTPWIISQAHQSDSNFLLVWVFLLLSTFLTSASIVWTYMLSGIGEVRSAERIFIISVLANYVICAILLLTGFKLWALAAGTFVSATLARMLGKRAFLKRIGHRIALKKPDWDLLKVLWPTAWRTGLVSVGGYGILYGSRLVCAAKLDLTTAASFALTQQLLLAISQISSAWLQVKLPYISSLRVQHRFKEIRSIVQQRLALSVTTFVLVAVTFIVVAPILLPLIGSNTHLLALAPLSLAAAIYLAETLASLSYNVVLTANHNPFILPTFISGICAIATYWLLASRFDVMGLLIGQLVIGCCFWYWAPFRIAMRQIARAH